MQTFLLQIRTGPSFFNINANKIFDKIENMSCFSSKDYIYV